MKRLNLVIKKLEEFAAKECDLGSDDKHTLAALATILQIGINFGELTEVQTTKKHLPYGLLVHYGCFGEVDQSAVGLKSLPRLRKLITPSIDPAKILGVSLNFAENLEVFVDGTDQPQFIQGITDWVIEGYNHQGCLIETINHQKLRLLGLMQAKGQ